MGLDSHPMSDSDHSSSPQRALVTGGRGFVGRSVVAALRASGIAVTVVDQEPFESTDPEISSVVGDLGDPDVRDAALTGDVTGVVHLAAVTSVLRSRENPVGTYQANVEVTQHLLELARQRGVGRFLMASTNAVVGNVGFTTITENTPLRPLTPYGATKAACEMLLSGYAGAYGMATCALRFTNIYGPGMEHKDSFVPRIMRAALAGRGVDIYGDGKQRRDLVHVADVTDAVLRAWQRKYTGVAIIGSGHSVSVLDLVDAAQEAIGKEIPVRHVPAPRGEMPAVIVDVSKAREELGYEPRYDLTAGLRTVWDDFLAAADTGAGAERAGAVG